MAFTVELGLEGVEGLSGIPGTVGASVVQNIGAYGQEVATSVESVEVWDRDTKTTRDLTPADLRFGYRYSALKTSMYAGPGRRRPILPDATLRGAFRHLCPDPLGRRHGRLRTACQSAWRRSGRPYGHRRHPQSRARSTCRQGHARGPTRYALPDMATAKREANILTDLERLASLNEAAGIPVGDDGLPAPDYNRHSCGSFFMNPILTADQAAPCPKMRRSSTRLCLTALPAPRRPPPGSSTMPAAIRDIRSMRTRRPVYPRSTRWP